MTYSSTFKSLAILPVIIAVVPTDWTYYSVNAFHATQRRVYGSSLPRRPLPSIINMDPVLPRPMTRTRVYASFESTRVGTETAPINGGDFDGGLLATSSSSMKEQLFSAFVALSDTDQYDAVLTGLCAKILDDKSTTSSSNNNEVASAVMVKLQDPLQLLQEMNQKRLVASPRSLMALIDATVKAQDASLMGNTLSLCLRNGGLLQYGSLQADLTAWPALPTSRVQCPDSSWKTRQERLDSVLSIPADTRAEELSNALIVSTVAATCTLTDIAHLDSISSWANGLLSLMFIVGVTDNFYDVIKSGSNFVAKQISKDNKDLPFLPEKKNLPLGLGTGQITGTTVRGFTRLLTIDAEREALCEGSALLAAYGMGLPCFAYQPNALEASRLVLDSIEPSSTTTTSKSNSPQMNSLLSSSGILRVLVWLLAPVAAESSKYPVCIMSNPKEAAGFLDLLEEEASSRSDIAHELWWMDDAAEKEALLKWAFTEADLLLRNNRKTLQEVTDRLAGGAATIADCIAVVENW